MNEPKVAYRNKLWLFCLPTCLPISYYTAFFFQAPCAPPPPKKKIRVGWRSLLLLPLGAENPN